MKYRVLPGTSLLNLIELFKNWKHCVEPGGIALNLKNCVKPGSIVMNLEKLC